MSSSKFGFLRPKALALFTAILTANTLTAAPKTPGLTPVTVVEGVQELRLPNGLQVLLYPDSSRPQVSLNITYRVGSKHEGYGETGMAHLLEHMLFKGTARHRKILDLYINHGAQVNGTTWVDRTNYFATLPASDENLNFLLDVEADRMVNSLIAPEDLASEFTVVRNEFERTENDHGRVLVQNLTRQAFQWHGYGHPTIGNRSDIEKVPADRLRAFYNKYYRPENATLIVGGDFNLEYAKKAIEKYFGPLQNPKTPIPATYTVEPPQEGPRHFVLERATDQAVVGVLYKVEASSHVLQPAFEAVINALTRKPTGYLYKELVEKGFASTVDGDSYRWADPSMMFFVARVKAGQNPDAVGQKLAELIENYDFKNFTALDVKRYQAAQNLEYAQSLADAQTFVQNLSESVAQGNWKLKFVQKQRVDSLDPAQLQKTKVYLQPMNRTLGIIHPSSKVQLLAEAKTPDLSSVQKFQSQGTDTSSTSVWRSDYASISSQSKQFKLSNGLEATVVAHKFKGDRIFLELSLPIGNAATLKNRQVAVKLLGNMLLLGTRSKNTAELQDALLLSESEIKSVTDYTMNGNNTIKFTAQTSARNFDAFMDIFTEVLRHPGFDASNFAALKEEKIAELREMLQDPENLNRREINRSLLPYNADDFRAIPSLAEEMKLLEKLQLNDLKNLYDESFGGSQGRFALVGNVNADSIQTSLEKRLGDWRAPQAYEAAQVKLQVPAQDSVKISTPNKKMARIGFTLPLSIKPGDKDYPALLAGVQILGTMGANRLWSRLREKEGVSYFAGAIVLPGNPYRSESILSSFAICASPVAEKALSMMQEEYTRIRDKGVTEAELKKAVHAFLEQRRNMRSDPGELVGAIGLNMFNQRDWAVEAALDQDFQALTVEQVNRALQKYLSPRAGVAISSFDDKAAAH